MWHNQLPSWVTAGDFNAEQLAQIIQTRCSTLVGHYKGQVYVCCYVLRVSGCNADMLNQLYVLMTHSLRKHPTNTANR